MELKFNSTNFFFIDEKTFGLQAFFILLREMIKAREKGKEVFVFVDEEIKERIKDISLSNARKGYLFEGYLDILDNYQMLRFVKTNSYLTVDGLVKEFKTKALSEKYILVQSSSIFQNFKILDQSFKNIQYLKYNNLGELEEWRLEQEKPSNAFYLEEDHYMNQIKCDDLDYVYSPKLGYLRLDKSKVIAGGEGSVYKTYDNYMVKIFHPSHITYTNYKKLATMVDMKIYSPSVGWPIDLVFHENNFIGFVMPNIADTKDLLHIRYENFDGLTHVDRFKICYNFLKIVNYLHMKNIIVGDMKPDNILVRNPEEVFLIDTGSFQVEDYPCPVCHPDYTKREFQQNELKTSLRTFNDEYYPINKIAFEILIRKSPSWSKDNTEIEAADKNYFPYPLKQADVKEMTVEMQIWFSLSERMREFFYYYFKEGRITYLSEWINEFEIFFKKNNIKY